MRRIKLKKRYKIKLSMVIIISIIICIIFLLRFINLKANPILLNYGELESRKIASIIINNAVSKNISSVDDLFLITKDDNDNIKTIDFNPVIVNKILTSTINSIQVNLKYLEKGKIDLIDTDLIDYDNNNLRKGIIYEIPSGVVFNNSFLSNLGPKIPVRLSLMGDIVGYINTKVTNYGINNALIEININLELSEQVILPFATSKIKMNMSVPLALKLIQGNVPNYYLNGINTNSNSLTLPIE